ncbi:hypothetical protein GCM10017668_68150 [Streptomyces tuirus]|uniref:Uncharacterized protein n=1 Tax=Streptomyces tuirus TaxID=68278 RepID=A0A7G1NR48_9ACTN|nr:hypothetical protein GCM10017668_68150 [Streptomyces tuirus]
MRGPGMLVRGLSGAPAGRWGPPAGVPVVQTGAAAWAGRVSGHRRRLRTECQEQSTRVTGVYTGPPLTFVESLNSA